MGKAAPTDTPKEMKIHKAVSVDGTEVAGRVHGQGPPLVLLPAGPGDSETSWQYMLPYLSKNFTCYLMNTRGRGLSGDHPDHSPGRLVQDVIAFAESIGEPVNLVEWGTTLWALVTAGNSSAISAVAAYEPGADEVMNEEVASSFQDIIFPRLGALVAEGKLDDAARVFIENSNIIYNEEELAHGAPSEFWSMAASNLPIFMQEQKQLAEEGGAGPTDSSTLARIKVPVLLIQGTRSRPWFKASIRHVADHVPASQVVEISSAGHFGPHTEPEAVAGEITRFFSK